MPDKIDPIRPTDDEARALAARLIAGASFAALGVIDPETGGPFVSRIAFGLGPRGEALSLVSDLSAHARALRLDSRVSLLVGEPGPKGDPLTHPRLSIRAEAESPAPEERAALRAAWLSHHPKAQLYVDFPDFRFVRFRPLSAFLNGGFGKAFELRQNDLNLATGSV